MVAVECARSEEARKPMRWVKKQTIPLPYPPKTAKKPANNPSMSAGKTCRKPANTAQSQCTKHSSMPLDRLALAL
jgi:hypothetical protein